MEDILLNIRDTPLDANTPSLYELMFHRKVKSDLPSIPLSLFDSTNSINVGHRSVKHAEGTNESENRVAQYSRDRVHIKSQFPVMSPLHPL